MVRTMTRREALGTMVRGGGAGLLARTVPLGVGAALASTRQAHAAGVVLDQADYVYDPTHPAEPDPAVWQKFASAGCSGGPAITPIFGADALVVVDPDSCGGLVYAHALAPLPAGATASFRVTLRVPPISDGSTAFDTDVAAGRIILDDGAKRAELQFARDSGANNARIISLGAGAGGQPIQYKWDTNIFTTYEISRAANGSMTVTITSSDPTIPVVTKTYSPGDLAPSGGSAMFAFGCGEQGGGAFGFSEAHGVVNSDVLLVTIVIKPGSDTPPAINLGAAGVIPVAILSTPTFDATQVMPDSVSLAGAKVRLIGKGNRFAASFTDVNNDGRLDLLCQVETAQFFLEPGESLAVLEAETYAGQKIRGEETIRIVP